MMDYSLIAAPVVAFLLGRIALAVVRRVAIAVGFLDSPDHRRKLQESPIPLGGGIAVWLATWSGLGIGLLGRSPGQGGIAGSSLFYLALSLASFSILVLGLFDDRYGMRGLHKLAGQVVTAAVLVSMGVRIDALGGFGLEVDLGVFAYPVTILWIILVVNAFNLIDGLDGFCGGIGLVASLTIAFLSCRAGRAADALVGLAVAGALVAFLRDNLPPARIYLGDAGSMTVGLMISALSVRACSDGPGTAVSVPLLGALVAMPLLDVATALGRRWLTGHSLFVPDRGHIHHRLRARLGSTPVALGVGVGLAAFMACAAAMARAWDVGDGVAVLSILVAVVLLAATNTFGGSESRLLVYRLRTIVSGFMARRSGQSGVVWQECHLVGVRDWSGIWAGLIRAVEAAGGRRVELAIDLPSAGETYHGIWTAPTGSESHSNWSIVHTLRVGDLHAGTLRVAGNVDASRTRYLDKVETLVRDLEDRLTEELRRDPAGRREFPAPPPAQLPMTQMPGHGMARLVARNSEF